MKLFNEFSSYFQEIFVIQGEAYLEPCQNSLIERVFQKKLTANTKDGTFCKSRKKLYLIWDKAFKNGPSKFCGRQPLKI